MPNSGVLRVFHQSRAIAIVKSLAYLCTLTIVCTYVLLQFLKPTPYHIGINQYENALFLDMVDGSAHKPYVYRRLLPGLVQILTSLVSESTRLGFFNAVMESPNLRFVFSVFNWEPEAAFQYSVAFFGMLIALMGFGHYGARFTLITCAIEDPTGRYRFILSVTMVLFLIPFFKYASYIYDPPTLFLFTLALYGLAQSKLWVFGIGFGLSCINKETAVLLIPIALWTYKPLISRRHYIALALGLVGVFVVVKGTLTRSFRSNPGELVEWHLWDHNLMWFMQSMGYMHVILGTILMGLFLYRWNEKEIILRRAFLCSAPVLVILTLFFGYIDEWRDYYEVYPVGFALTVDSLRRFKNLVVKKLSPTP